MNIVKTVIKYLHRSHCKTIQMLYHGTAASVIRMYTMLVLCVCISSHVYCSPDDRAALYIQVYTQAEEILTGEVV